MLACLLPNTTLQCNGSHFMRRIECMRADPTHTKPRRRNAPFRSTVGCGDSACSAHGHVRVVTLLYGGHAATLAINRLELLQRSGCASMV
jgi:hypothetical protein